MRPHFEILGRFERLITQMRFFSANRSMPLQVAQLRTACGFTDRRTGSIGRRIRRSSANFDIVLAQGYRSAVDRAVLLATDAANHRFAPQSALHD
jgi:hypothetical protein